MGYPQHPHSSRCRGGIRYVRHCRSGLRYVSQVLSQDIPSRGAMLTSNRCYSPVPHSPAAQCRAGHRHLGLVLCDPPAHGRNLSSHHTHNQHRRAPRTAWPSRCRTKSEGKGEGSRRVRQSRWRSRESTLLRRYRRQSRQSRAGAVLHQGGICLRKRRTAQVVLRML